MSKSSQMSPKVTIHYLDSSSYTYKNIVIDCFVDWDSMECTLLDASSGWIVEKVCLTEDTLVIQQTDNTGISTWNNPRYNVSTQVSIMTAKQRARINNPDTRMSKIIRWMNKGWLRGTGMVAVSYDEFQQMRENIENALTREENTVDQ